MKKQQRFAPAIIGALFFTTPVLADVHTHGGTYANTHGPIGVMGDHRHKKNEWMLSYRFMTMDMDGNRSGSSNISPEEIATTVPNRLAGQPMQPLTLRVVPTRMTTDMRMFGAMLAPTDSLTLMVMANYIEKEMDHITFQGGAGVNRLGTFTTTSSGWGDLKAAGLVKIYDTNKHKVHLNLGVSIPTGSITKKDRVLAPNGARPELRLPYAMQLGSGTLDFLPGITYQMYQNKWNFGGQYTATIRAGENDEDYTLGDEHKLTGWASYSWLPSLSTSVRLAYMNVDNIDGSDPQITAPVTTADPNNYGKDRLDLHAGINWAHNSGHRLALEIGAPVYQHLDGPQLEMDWTLTAGYQYAY